MSVFRMTEEQLAAHKAKNARKPAQKGVSDGFAMRLPFPPTVNHSSGPTASGGRFLTKAHKEFRTMVATIVAGRRVEGRLVVSIDLSAPNNRRYDIDNRVKAVLDALQKAGAFDDDWQIDELHVRRLTVGGDGCWVNVARIGP